MPEDSGSSSTLTDWPTPLSSDDELLGFEVIDDLAVFLLNHRGEKDQVGVPPELVMFISTGRRRRLLGGQARKREYR